MAPRHHHRHGRAFDFDHVRGLFDYPWTFVPGGLFGNSIGMRSRSIFLHGICVSDNGPVIVLGALRKLRFLAVFLNTTLLTSLIHWFTCDCDIFAGVPHWEVRMRFECSFFFVKKDLWNIWTLHNLKSWLIFVEIIFCLTSVKISEKPTDEIILQIDFVDSF